MYTLETPLERVRGIGAVLTEKLQALDYTTVRDLLLTLPLRYEDLSQLVTIDQLPHYNKQKVTIRAHITSVSNQYRGRKSMQRGSAKDSTGTVKLMWFNNPHVVGNIKEGETYFISGTYNAQYKNIAQPKIEKASEQAIHTNRLVPLYTSTIPFSPGKMRRILKEILDHLSEIPDPLATIDSTFTTTFNHYFSTLHYPEEPDEVVSARERFALDEFLALMRLSEQYKQNWEQNKQSAPITCDPDWLPENLPFELTNAQKKATKEILTDLGGSTPMNRLLIGDVGSGKTVVAATAIIQTLANSQSAALIAPTKILAEQHQETFAQLFPDIETQLLTSSTKTKLSPDIPTLFVGTHSVINTLETIDPKLIIYDEQHRFGVQHRSEAQALNSHPNILTMTATPIPRSMMLTIFSHLEVSVLDEMPQGRQPVKTWLVPEKKRRSSYDWLVQEIVKSKTASTPKQILIVCPFISPSKTEAFSHVASVKEKMKELREYLKKNHPHSGLRLAPLHSKLGKKMQADTIEQLYAQEIDILVTTPVVEVGIDLKNADIIVIENAERFGLASLHQLRGRVGRRQQQGYCLLFASQASEQSTRLKKFCDIHNGMELAQLDLENRGAGDLFGVQQSGFDQLRFGSWANVGLIARARELYGKLNENWQPVLKTTVQQIKSTEVLPN